ncbi:4-(cytidine 5'-diphospho)-2-C-methyl-D-erythritol kinase [Aphanothece sacrum]|uniref:4-diphosphocytidyl-2-C-methyl-D-erythritol kinase n=1 Tax=Aphanothece sacrum FPU1 TaxID=1920663 RepID=A0A401IHH0_APHSA|nr:4-(cytidine 5'-diphospho)-2-C-methyl-D-erythritol kinase [Aphanothece sacrum]GBF80679.1 4-diphosphocytidyl-2-C-methyl-D-erythritol kinase [Aphanothece sacrum FPU1]GBF83173.1 4-diphosphocytidyl-2-C-methyl-D-erythritol kinase [Aphanothece sacrum FPU3]
MKPYTLIAPAKINLYLEIIGDRLDGYHELVMILQSIELADRLEIRPNGTQHIRLHCDHPQVPLDATNLAYRAAQLMIQEFPTAFANYGGIDITLDKRIPVAAGLAGGSTNAAAILVGLDLMWELGLTLPALRRLGEKLGSDVPFCIGGGTAIATGRGEKLDPIQDLDNLWVVLAKYNSIAVSTPWAYQTYKKQFVETYIRDHGEVLSRSSEVHSGPFVQAITQKNGVKIGELIHNDLEKIVLPEYPKVAQLRDILQQLGGLGTMMSGSGPTVFTLCESKIEAETIKKQAKEMINDPDLEFWVTQLSSSGIQVE